MGIRGLWGAAVATLLACGNADVPASEGRAAPSTEFDAAVSAEGGDAACANEQGLTYVCGLVHPEDLAVLGSTGLILASGQRRPGTPTGRIHLVDPATGAVAELVHSPSFREDHDAGTFPDCPGPLNRDSFAAHGMSVEEITPQRFSVHTVSHGAREAVEAYELDLTGPAPSLVWIGCVPLPSDGYFNGIVRLSDGGFVVTRMRDAEPGPRAARDGPAATGALFEWHPGRALVRLPDTELVSPNGIDVSPDERFLYVAQSALGNLVRFDRTTAPMERHVVSLPVSPDNVHWGRPGKLLTVGANPQATEPCGEAGCARGWSVVEVDVQSWSVTRVGGADASAVMQRVSAAVELDGEIWVSTHTGDRIARFPRPVAGS